MPETDALRNVVERLALLLAKNCISQEHEDECRAIAARLRAGGGRDINPMNDALRSWPHDEGSYFAWCFECRQQFTGNKGRIVCRVCTEEKAAHTPASPAPLPVDADVAAVDEEVARVTAGVMAKLEARGHFVRADIERISQSLIRRSPTTVELREAIAALDRLAARLATAERERDEYKHACEEMLPVEMRRAMEHRLAAYDALAGRARDHAAKTEPCSLDKAYEYNLAFRHIVRDLAALAPKDA